MNQTTRITTALLDALHAAPAPFMRSTEQHDWRRHRAQLVAELAAGLGFDIIEDAANTLHSTLCKPITDPAVRALLEAGGAVCTDIRRDAAGFSVEPVIIGELPTLRRPQPARPNAPASLRSRPALGDLPPAHQRDDSAVAPAAGHLAPAVAARQPAADMPAPCRLCGQPTPAPLPYTPR